MLFVELLIRIIIKLIKDSLEKELSLSAKEEIKNILSDITLEWDNILSNAYTLMTFLYENGYEYDFKKTIKSLVSDKEEVSMPINYTHSPIETLYLKILQHEYLGNISDISKINNIESETNYNVPPEFIAEMKKLNDSYIDINDIEKYIDKNAFKMAKYVYLKLKPSAEEVRRIRTYRKKVHKWLDFCIRAKPLLNIKDIANELQVISFLQTLILDSQNETFDYIFHGYQNYMKHKPQVQAALKSNNLNKDTQVIDALQVYWTRKVSNRWHANMGRYNMFIKVRELEKVCDNILEDILKRPNLCDMLDRQIHYIMKLDNELIATDTQIQATQKFIKYLHNRGFEYRDDNYKIRYAFLCNAEISIMYKNLIDLIDDTIKNNSQLLHVTLEEDSPNVEKQIELDFKLSFDYQNKICTMSEFKQYDMLHVI